MSADPLGATGGRPKGPGTISRMGTETRRTEIWWGPGDGRTSNRYSAAQSVITPNRIGLMVLGQGGHKRYRVDGILIEDWSTGPWPSTPWGDTQKHICGIIRRQLRKTLDLHIWGFDATLVEWER
jgi:hypothetical protein